MFEAGFSDATVVTLFLYPNLDLKLRPRLLNELKPGTRVVRYYHDIAGWAPLRTVATPEANVCMWRIPPRPLE